MKPMKAMVLLLLVLPGGFLGVWKLQHGIDGERAALNREGDDILLHSGKLVKLMSLEFSPLLADFYWTRVVQFYGNKHVRGDANLEGLWPLLDITTTLDPHLLVAYRFGAMFLGQSAPAGAGRPDLAVKLIERGIQANPDYWRFYEDLGFVYYFDLKDYPKASQAFLEGSKIPGAQLWMKAMAARIEAQGESYEISMALWSEIYQSTSDPVMRENAKMQLQLLKAKEDCRRLNLLSSDYHQRTGQWPRRMSQLVESGLLHGLPRDPLGFAYVFDEQGKAALSVDSPLLEQQLLLEHFK